MKAITKFSSLVLLASSMVVASNAMAAGDRVVPTRDGRTSTSTNPTPLSVTVASAPAPVAANGSTTITPTVTGGTFASIAAVAGTGTQGNVTCGPSTCTYTNTTNGAVSSDTVGVVISFTVNSVAYSVTKFVQLTISPPAAS